MNQIPVVYYKDNIVEVHKNNPEITHISDDEYESRIKEGLKKQDLKTLILNTRRYNAFKKVQ